ncbi:MAG: tetratricopeptide repeat protein, partial [Salibacteraceae bacterium]
KVHQQESQLDSALYFFDLALGQVDANDVTTRASIYFDQGNAYQQKGKLEAAMDAFSSAMADWESLGSDSGRAVVNEAVGLIYLKQGQASKALERIHQSLSFKEQTNDSAGMAKTYNLLGSVYAQQGQLQIAGNYFRQSVQLWEASNQPRYLSSSINNLANVYAALGRNAEAEDLNRRCLTLKTSIGDQRGMDDAYNNLGNFYFTEQEYPKALDYFQESALLGKKLKANRILAIAQENLAYTYEQLGNYQEAYVAMWRCDSIRQVISQERYSRDVAELQEQFEAQKKDYQIASLEKENQLKAFDLEKAETRLWFWGLVSGLLLLLVGGMVYSVVSHRRKNSLLEEKNLQIEQQRKEVEEKNEELRQITGTKDRLFSIIAHNLRGPLSSLGGISGVMRHYMKNGRTDKLERVIVEVDNTAFQTNALVENLLNWAAVESQSIPYRPQEIDLEGVLRQCIELVSVQAELKSITVELQLEASTSLLADLNYVKTIMTNLLHNALKFTPNGGKVTVQAAQVGDRAEIRIRDTGVGIASQRLENLFKANADKSTFGTSGEQGTGLGLYVSYQFVKKEGGELQVTSEQGKGTEFAFTLGTIQAHQPKTA